MVWKIEFFEKSRKQFNKLDKGIQKEFIKYMRNITTKNPKDFAKPLSGNMAGLWRFRYNDYRMVCQIFDDELVILVLNVAHRKIIDYY